MKKPKTRHFEVTEGRQLKSIDLTPTWTALVPALLDAYANADPLRRDNLRGEFLHMASVADLAVEDAGLVTAHTVRRHCEKIQKTIDTKTA